MHKINEDCRLLSLKKNVLIFEYFTPQVSPGTPDA